MLSPGDVFHVVVVIHPSQGYVFRLVTRDLQFDVVLCDDNRMNMRAQRPIAAIVWKKDKRATEDELTAHLAGAFAKFWMPDAYVFVEQIPRTSTGSSSRRACATSMAACSRAPRRRSDSPGASQVPVNFPARRSMKWRRV